MDTHLPFRAATACNVFAAYKKCAWCGKRIVNTRFDRHHWCIKRGKLPPARFGEIDLVVNVVPLHTECHAEYGQSQEMEERCAALVEKRFGAEITQQFKEAIWR